MENFVFPYSKGLNLTEQVVPHFEKGSNKGESFQ